MTSHLIRRTIPLPSNMIYELSIVSVGNSKLRLTIERRSITGEVLAKFQSRLTQSLSITLQEGEPTSISYLW